jgi:hypothetical protein
MTINPSEPSFKTAETLAVRSAATRRGMASIPEAVAFVEQLCDRIVTKAVGRDDADARYWVDDRIRLFMAIDAGRWFSAAGLDDPPLLSELGTPIFGEFAQLVRSPERFRAGHLIAWFWLLHRDVFGPRVDAMLEMVTPILVEAVAEMAARGADWRGEMVDWDSFMHD